MGSTLKKENLKANGMEYLCRTAGLDNDGELVIFLHGYPESSIVWEGVIVKMAELGYRCLAPNQRGYSVGARPKGYEHYNYETVSSDVIGFADAVGCTGKFHLVGHDWGASCGWTVVARFPERIQSWVGMSTPYTPAFNWALENDPVQYEKSFYIREYMEPDKPEESLSKDDYARMRNLWKGFDQRIIDDYMEIFSDPEGLTACVNWYRGALKCGNNIEYGDVYVPTAFIWGSDDLALGRSGAEKTADFMKGPYQFHELKGAGHWLMQFNEEECTDIIIDHIKKFPIK